MKPRYLNFPLSLIICCSLLTNFSFIAFAQVIPANDNDIEKVIAKIPPIQRVSSACVTMDCPVMDCRTVQAFQIRVRDARMYMRHLYYWLQRAGYAQMEHLKSVASETMMAADRAAKVQKILAWQQYVVSIASGLLEIASAGSNFSEIVNDPKLLKEKTHGEMAELFDKFYEGSKDVESFIHRLMADRFDKDFPQPFAKLMPAFAGITSDEMNELKSHLSDIKDLMKAGAEYGKDWRKILKEGKGLASIGQITGRILKAYADAEIKEREQLVDDLLAGIIANDQVQSQSFKDLQRIQKRRNLAEDAFRALENLVVIDATNKGNLTRCLMKHASIHKIDCSSLDFGYVSKIVVPKDFEAELFDHPGAEGKAKNYGNALLYFNARLPQVVALLSDVPSLPPGIKSSLKTTKSVYSPGENLTVDFTASPCLSADSWVAIFPASQPHGDDLASAGYLVSGRARLEGKSSGSLQFKAPDKVGAYQLRMFDAGTGKEIATYNFTVGSEGYILSGIYIEQGRENYKQFIKIEFYDNGSSARFLSRDEKDSTKWRQYRNGKIIGNTILYMGSALCGTGPDGRGAGGEERRIPYRYLFDENRSSFKIQSYKVDCDNKGRMTVKPEWDERPNRVFYFIRVR